MSISSSLRSFSFPFEEDSLKFSSSFAIEWPYSNLMAVRVEDEDGVTSSGEGEFAYWQQDQIESILHIY
jgi:L-alanine-DL-glutamate epimerase-like enolase superfamily enzyme